VQGLHAYTPGEQPKVRGLIKLNTNENPFPPAPAVLHAIRAATDARLRLYPNPTADSLRARLARFHGCSVENIIVGNGSDELLALAVRCFVEPLPAAPAGSGISESPSPCRVQYLAPSYSLYPVLADIHGASRNAVLLERDFALPRLEALRSGGTWDFSAALTLITTPNAPSGRGYSTSELDGLCRAMRGVVVLDEAYVDFAPEHALSLALKHPHVLVARTFSKAYSLCFLRVGYLVGHPDLIRALQKIRDSYNVNGLGQVAAEATLGCLAYYRRNFRCIIASRERLAMGLHAAGFSVLPSHTNFLMVEPPDLPAERWFQALRERRILVRWFTAPEISRYLRISVGSDDDVDALLRAVADISRERSGKGRSQRSAIRVRGAGRGSVRAKAPAGSQ
jgi:histidinol-phosphate aminotransferase